MTIEQFNELEKNIITQANKVCKEENDSERGYKVGSFLDNLKRLYELKREGYVYDCDGKIV